MSRSFYWVYKATSLPTGEPLPIDEDSPVVHLGKYAQGQFMWTQDPVRVREILAARPDEALVMDEVGRHYTAAEFTDFMTGVPEDIGSVGRVFC